MSIYRDVLCQLDRQRLLKHLVQSLQGFHVLYNAGYIKKHFEKPTSTFLHELYTQAV